MAVWKCVVVREGVVVVVVGCIMAATGGGDVEEEEEEAFSIIMLYRLPTFLAMRNEDGRFEGEGEMGMA